MNGYEVQVDLGTGHVLQTAYRRSDLIESIHDGSFFGGDWTKLGLFLPAGLTLLLLWLGGLWMFWVPFGAKWKRARVPPKRAAQSATNPSQLVTDRAPRTTRTTWERPSSRMGSRARSAILLAIQLDAHHAVADTIGILDRMR